MKSTHALLGCLLLSLAACGSEEDAPVADNSVPSVRVGTGRVLPIEDNAAGPVTNAAASEKAMPAALHGRWGLKAADCTAPGANGLVTVTADEVRFYESVAKPETVRSRSETAIQGDFAFSGEGMTWSGPMSWSVSGDELTRVDSEGDSRLVYTRC